MNYHLYPPTVDHRNDQPSFAAHLTHSKTENRFSSPLNRCVLSFVRSIRSTVKRNKIPIGWYFNAVVEISRVRRSAEIFIISAIHFIFHPRLFAIDFYFAFNYQKCQFFFIWLSSAFFGRINRTTSSNLLIFQMFRFNILFIYFSSFSFIL